MPGTVAVRLANALTFPTVANSLTSTTNISFSRVYMALIGVRTLHAWLTRSTSPPSLCSRLPRSPAPTRSSKSLTTIWSTELEGIARDLDPRRGEPVNPWVARW